MWNPYPPLPSERVRFEVMRMWWLDLFFIHFAYPPETVQALLPPDLVVDTWPGDDGTPQAWVALVPFEMTVGTPGGLRLPMVGRFPETNVRTYVRGPDGTPGVWFCSLEAGGLAATVAARAAYGLPYFWADMTIDGTGRAPGDRWRYESTRRWPRRHTGDGELPVHRSEARIGATIDPDDVSPFEHFLTARWGLFSRFPSMETRRAVTLYAPVDHGRWPLHRAELLHLDDQLLEAAGLPSPAGEPVLHWTPGTEVRIGRPRRAASGRHRDPVDQPSAVP